MLLRVVLTVDPNDGLTGGPVQAVVWSPGKLLMKRSAGDVSGGRAATDVAVDPNRMPEEQIPIIVPELK